MDDDCNQLIDEDLGIIETGPNGIIIYPNPAADILFIQWPHKEKVTF